MKYFLVTVAVALLAIVLLTRLPHSSENTALVTGLPWQIEQLPEGRTRVFGVIPGETVLGQAMALFGPDLELAIIAAPGEPGVLEAYYSHYSAGPITGALILVMDVAADQLAAMQARSFHDGGSRRYRLHPDDLAAASQAIVHAMTFSPAFSISEAVVLQRFGKPAAVVEGEDRQKHYLYPDKGLDVLLQEGGKDVLQYLPPAAFPDYRNHLP